MRILNVIRDGYPTFRPDVSALFGRYLPRLGVHSDLVAQASSELVDAPGEWGGGRVLLSRRTGRPSKDQLRAFAHDIRALWRAHPDAYDAIQVRDKVFAAVFAVWIGRRRRLPVFYWMSFPVSDVYIKVAKDGGFAIGLARWLFLMAKGHVGKILLYRYVLPGCTHVFVQSERMRDDVAALGVDRTRTSAVPMGVDLERPIPAPWEAFRHPKLQGRRIVAYLGSFERYRQLDFLLEVMQQLVTTTPDAVLLMIGDGVEPQDRNQLETKAFALGIADRIVWTGWVCPADAWRWLINAHVAVSIVPRGALYDCASPTKVAEYLALGIPAVVNDQPDQKTMVDASGAGICCEMEHAPFVSALEYILSHPQVAEDMRAAGPRYVAGERGYARIALEVATTYRRHVGTKL